MARRTQKQGAKKKSKPSLIDGAYKAKMREAVDGVIRRRGLQPQQIWKGAGISKPVYYRLQDLGDRLTVDFEQAEILRLHLQAIDDQVRLEPALVKIPDMEVFRWCEAGLSLWASSKPQFRGLLAAALAAVGAEDEATDALDELRERADAADEADGTAQPPTPEKNRTAPKRRN